MYHGLLYCETEYVPCQTPVDTRAGQKHFFEHLLNIYRVIYQMRSQMYKILSYFSLKLLTRTFPPGVLHHSGAPLFMLHIF